MLARVPDLPFRVPASLWAVVGSAIDQEGKLDRALETLGPLAGRDVLALDPSEDQVARWTAAGARLRIAPSMAAATDGGIGPSSIDTIVSPWAGFRGIDAPEIAAADRFLRPGGRLLVLHDYGRDDLATLRGEQPEHGSWTRRDGPFLTNGFRVRVIHCFWTFADLEGAQAVVGELFGDAGRRFADELKRPRLSWNVAIYHRTRGGAESG
jgi:hypothetical protein